MAYTPTDTRFPDQWHLENGDPGEFDLNVCDVWDDYDGSGIRVAVIDTGFNYNHEDFDNYRFDLDRDFEFNDGNAGPSNDGDTHGTMTMGIIGAAENGVGTVGVAFGADMIGYKTSWGRDEMASALDLARIADHDVVNMSYWFNGLGTADIDSGLVGAAEDAAEFGRGGLGLIIVKGAGNGRLTNDDANDEPFQNIRETIVVAAAEDDGGIHPQSTPGASVLVSGFTGLNTTRLSDWDAFNTSQSEYMTNGGITSAAAPTVAGVAALVLDANPNLGWRDVQTILSYSARNVGSNVGANAQGNEQSTQSNGSTWFWNNADNWNGGALHFSNDYGFGLVDAKAAVRLAETWDLQSTSANEDSSHADGLNTETTIAEGSTSGGSNFFNITETDNILIEQVTLGINFITYSDVADLDLFLTSPGGTRVQLFSDYSQSTAGGNAGYTGYWRFGANAFRGETSAGTWRVQIRDDDNAVTSPITINDIDLWTYGSPANSDDLFIFTEEFSNYDGVAGHSTNFAGGGGTNTINAAAVDSDSIVNLQTGTGRIDGVNITLSGIDVVYTGDGDDELRDGPGNNRLEGRRGDDVLVDTSAGGSDEYRGGRGDDLVEVSSSIGSDAFFGGPGTDTINWSTSFESGATFDLAAGTASDGFAVETMSSFENFIGTAQNDTIIESVARNEINGFSGNDTVVVTSVIGTDSFTGGFGTDLIDWSGSSQVNGLYDLAGGTASSGSNTETMFGFENFIGTGNRDRIIEGSGANTIDAGGGDDQVFVTTTIGVDSFTGGFGTDLIDWSGSSQVNGLYDLGVGTASSGGNTETMFGFENFVGTGNRDRIIEGNGANDINAGGGDDQVFVTTTIGVDSFTGGFGTDLIDWSGSSQVNGLYDLGGGTASSGGNTETMFGFENFVGTGNGDRIIEGNGANTINAGAGDDHVFVTTTIGVDSFTGGFGTDLIDWSGSSQVNGLYDLSAGLASIGASTETMFGFENFIGTGNRDRIIEGNGANDINAGSGDDQVFVTTTIGVDSFTGGFGTDLIDWSGSSQVNGFYDLSAGLASFGGNTETMFGFENLVGTGNRDRIVEGNGANDINAGGGDDQVFVTTTIGVDSFAGGSGTDLIDWSSSSQANGLYNLAAGIASFGASTETMSGFENVVGTDQADTIVGDGGANWLDGRDGDDSIDGGGGDDWLRGGAGNDTLMGGFGYDTLDGGAGSDTADLSHTGSAATIDLASGQVDFAGGTETLISIENAIGTNGDNTIIGTDGANMLAGGDGDDTLMGGFGYDTLDGGAGSDTADLSHTGSAASINLATGQVDFAGGTETLISIENVIGTNGDNTITGTVGNNRFDGMGGDDTFAFAGANSADTIGDFQVSGADRIDFTAYGPALDSIDDFTIAQVGDHTVISDYNGAGNSITLLDFDEGDLGNEDFIFS